eukprot:4317363-Amphidinium_carterae.1
MGWLSHGRDAWMQKRYTNQHPSDCSAKQNLSSERNKLKIHYSVNLPIGANYPLQQQSVT